MRMSHIKNKYDRWLPAVIAGLVLVGAATWASLLLPKDTATPVQPADEQRQATQTTYPPQTLKVWDGKLARFVGNGTLPAEIYDVPAASLPEEVREELTSGITVFSEEELFSLLENFLS